MLNPIQKEELRHAALEVLATREGTALPLPAIRRRIEKDKTIDFDYEDGDLRAALSVLLALSYISVTHDGLGSTEHFQADAAGVLFHERSQK